MSSDPVNLSDIENSSRSAPKIGIFGHYGDKNLGDEAIIEAFVVRIRRSWPNAELRMFSMHPADTALRYSLPAFPIRQETEWQLNELGSNSDEKQISSPVGPVHDSPSAPRTHSNRASILDRIAHHVPRSRMRSWLGARLRSVIAILREFGFAFRSFGRVRGLDAMYVTGSNQFLDNFGGPWGFPYTLLKWSLLCRLARCRVSIVSVGAGPLDAHLSHRMVRWSLKLADYVSFRDAGSRTLIARHCGLSGPVLPDLAHSLEFQSTATHTPTSGQSLVVAINPMPVFDPRFWHAPDPARYRRQVHVLAGLVRHLDAARHEVSFFATHIPDADVARDAIAVFGRSHRARAFPIQTPTSVQELMQTIDQADLVIATRFHGILLALRAAKPVIAICYYRKSRELMRQFNQERFAIDIDDLDEADLNDRFDALLADRVQVRAEIEAANMNVRAALESQYRALFDQLSGDRSTAE